MLIEQVYNIEALEKFFVFTQLAIMCSKLTIEAMNKVLKSSKLTIPEQPHWSRSGVYS